jgi:myo-inositol-1-phosphate synthase
MWLIGARGAISTCVAYGLSALKQGLIDPVGIVTARAPFAALDLVSLDDLVLGGHDVCLRTISDSAGEFASSGILPPDLIAACAQDATAFQTCIQPGVLDGPDVGLADLDPRVGDRSSRNGVEQVRAIVADLDAFQERTGVDRIVVVNVASTEAVRASQPEWESRAAFERSLQGGKPQPASTVYAYAALSSGRPFVNFTPSLASSIPALRALAREKNVPHCGSDAKTGETLIKTALAPTFAKRALRMLAWQGYNMLGNRDGEVLRDEAHRQAKVRNKDEALRSLFPDQPDLHTKVGIDYVPSLADWKTAWDYVHFEGFLGVRMSLQFTWVGSDSALAAPLVLDLVRLADYAAEQGEGGEMTHTACFFKDPMAGGTHDFHLQHEELLRYAERHAAGRPARD